MKHDITPLVAETFIRRAAAMGYDVRRTNAEGDINLCLIAFMGKKEVCSFEVSGDMWFNPDNPLIAERKQLHHLLLNMKQAYELYTDAAPLEIQGVRDFRLVSQFGNVLLAAKMSKDNEVRFTTWEYSYYRTGVSQGHYYETNYEGAKRDFAVRAGLIDERQLFTRDELAVLYDACMFCGQNDDEISYGDEKKLPAVMERVEENIPDLILAKEQSEQEDSHGIQPD